MKREDTAELRNFRIFFLITIIVAAALVIDGMVTKLPIYSYQYRNSETLILLFVFELLISLVSQILYLKLTMKDKTLDFGLFKLNTRVMKFVIIGSQISLMIMASMIAINIVMLRSYPSELVERSVIISSLLSVCILSLLFIRFTSWFTTSKNKNILIYTLAILGMILNSIVVLLYSYFSFLNSYDLITPGLASINDTPFTYVGIKSVYLITSILQFSLTWVVAVILLRGYSFKIGRLKFWILMIIPLVYFVSKFQFLFINIFTLYDFMSPVEFFKFYTISFAVTDLAGGLLFGIAFWTISRNISDSVVKFYMNMSGVGILLFFISSSITGITLLPYPPFGLLSNSFMGLASYLLLIGIYQSAVRASAKAMIRASVRKSILTELRFIESIGTSHMEQEIERRVTNFTRKHASKFKEETQLEFSIDPDDIKDYMKEIMAEVKKLKNRENGY